MDPHFALIVEDDLELGGIFALVLQVAGLQTQVVADGRQALDMIIQKTPDIVLLDMHLPGMSGLEILERIRANEQLRRIKVVVVTADALLANAAGIQADLTLIKPVSVDQLSELSARLLAAH